MRSNTRSIATMLGSLGIILLLCGQQAVAQIDLSGSWTVRLNQDQVARTSGPDPVAYMGVPLNDQGKAKALTYSPENISVLQRQCVPWPAHYLMQGPFSFRMYPTFDEHGKVVAWNLTGAVDREPTTIWLGEREPPSANTLHTPGGYTTGRWEGDTLVARTTHISDGYLARNGIPSSDREVITMYITRHDHLLTITAVIEDPVYLTEPYVLSGVWVYDFRYAVEDPPNSDPICTPVEEVANLGTTGVPVYATPEDNPNLKFETERYNIPHDAALGGRETMYPEYAKRIRGGYTPPPGFCTYQCCGAQGAGGVPGFDRVFATEVLKCPGGD